MTLISFKHNVAAVFAIILTIWALHSFFSWHTAPTPEEIPEKISESLEILHGEPVFLSSQLLDKLVLNHPEINFFPAGGNSLKNAKTSGLFYILQKFQTLDCTDIDKEIKSEIIAQTTGFTLKKCYSSQNSNIVYASSFIEKMTVTTDDFEIPAKFINGQFRTGPSGWQKIETGSAEFGDDFRTAVSAHPLPDKKKITIVIPSVDINTKKIVLGAGIANSGVFKGSRPVIITAFQNSLKKEIKSADGKWVEHELKNFSGSEPVTITVHTEKSGKRHFYFDLKYFEAEK
ncbi:MAG TPA: hypothetical protein PLB16_02235 [bacterium]|nr:hypothetical protein [bacterium]